jgi:hypothetical protein
MYTRILPILLLSYAGTAMAGTATGRITTITVHNDQHAVLFQLDKPIAKTPRCNESQHFSIHLLKPGGMAAYMALLEAKQQGYTVLIEGMNNCSNEWKSEDVKSIILD